MYKITSKPSLRSRVVILRLIIIALSLLALVHFAIGFPLTARPRHVTYYYDEFYFKGKGPYHAVLPFAAVSYLPPSL